MADPIGHPFIQGRENDMTMDVNELVDRATELMVRVREENALAPTQTVARRQAEALAAAGYLTAPTEQGR